MMIVKLPVAINMPLVYIYIYIYIYIYVCVCVCVCVCIADKYCLLNVLSSLKNGLNCSLCCLMLEKRAVKVNFTATFIKHFNWIQIFDVPHSSDGLKKAFFFILINDLSMVFTF